MRAMLVASCLALLIAGCSTGEPSLADYASQAEQLLTAMNSKIDTLDAQIEEQGLTLANSREFWETKVEARTEFIAGLGALDPPDEAAEMHAAALSIVGRLKTADQAVAELIGSMETVFMAGTSAVWTWAG